MSENYTGNTAGYKKVVGLNRRILLLRTAFVWMLFQVFLFLLHFLLTGTTGVSLVFSLSLILTALIVVAAERQYATRWLGIALMLVVFVSMSSLSLAFGGIHSPTVIFVIFVPVATFMLVSRPAGWIATLIVCIYFALLGWLEIDERLVDTYALSGPQHTFVKSASFILVLVCISGIGWYYSRLYDRFYLSLKKTNLELHKNAQYKTEFLSSMSHEFRTPLNAIIGFSRRLCRNSENQLAERDKKSLEAILRNGELMQSLVNNVLQMAEIETGKASVNREQTDLICLLLQIVEDYRPAAETKGLSIEYLHGPAVSPEKITALIDVDKFRRVVTALVANAIKYTEQGRVCLSLAVEGQESFYVSVSDTGPGVSASDIPLIFNRFKRLAAQQNSATIGTGLGLAIAQELVKLLGGEITVESELGQGSVFRARFPLA